MLNFYLIALPDFSSPEIWLSLLTLTFLEVVLGIDNIIFISIAANKLAKEDQPKARNIGLILAMLFRILLLLGLSYLIGMQKAFWHIDTSFLTAHVSGQSIILFIGGIFLLYKSTSEIHHKLEGEDHSEQKSNKAKASMANVITQIALINIVFSFDSILTAIGLTDEIFVMIAAVVISVIIMMLFAGPVGNFVNKHPSVQMLGMAFLLLIGFMLITEAAHLSHVKLFSSEIGAIPKGYLYFAIAFSLLVEFLNMRMRGKKSKPVQLHGIQEEAKSEGLL